MKLNEKKFIIMIVAFMIIGFCYLPVMNAFTITDIKTGKLVYSRSIRQTQSFYTTFIHSVNRVPVYEYYKIVDNKFVVYKTTFYSYGAGMPEYNPEHHVTIKDGMVSIDNLNTVLEDFAIFVGTVANHKIVFQDKEYSLSQFTNPGNDLKFEIKRVSIYNLLKVVGI